MRRFVLSKKYWILALLVIVGSIILYFQYAKQTLPEGVELGIVQKGGVMEIVSETGWVKGARSVDLAFERGGKVASSTVQVGDTVVEGQLLMSTNASELRSNLAIAESRLEAERIRLEELLRGADSASLAVTESALSAAEVTLENAQRNLTDVRAYQNQLVLNSQKTLMSSGLQAYLVSDERENSAYSYEAPTLTGTYTGEEEGMYRLELYGSGAPSGSSFTVSGLEDDTQSVSTVNPVAFGDRGLHAQFPENFARNTEWEIPVPNTRSSAYLTNLNAYNAVLESRNVSVVSAENAVKTAEAALAKTKLEFTQVSSSARDERIDAQRALVRQMEALVSQAQVAYDNTSIRAPFSGVVTAVSPEVGQIVPAGMTVVSLISENDYEIAVDITEADISGITVGDPATVSFEAYDDVELTAKVTNVAPSAKDVSGVRVFAVTLTFDDANDLIREGLTANLEITSSIREGVIVIPTRSIYENEQGKYVRTITDNGQIIEVSVVTGLRGSNGMTEITNGLLEGTQIITFASEEAIEELKKQ